MNAKNEVHEKFDAKIRNFGLNDISRFEIKSIRALLGRDDYQNEDCSYNYTAKRRQAFLKS